MSGRDWKVELHMAIEAEVGRPINKPICNIIADAGYRILAPGEIDKETVERAVEIVTAGNMDREMRAYAGYFAAAIRSLSDKEQGR
jgi:hypothetical protein